jgi:ATP-binding cassette subfamily C (CFTR/MRP) protein 4
LLAWTLLLCLYVLPHMCCFLCHNCLNCLTTTCTAVQLLDDPLSAVDPRVGRILFDQCIGNSGIMAGAVVGQQGSICRQPVVHGVPAPNARSWGPTGGLPAAAIADGRACTAGATRLLVTHQRQFLPACDALLVLRGGEVACR